ncbi:MAG: GNAT family N-acetyltransferase [Rhodococcus sp.]|nr:GNAT family N-acetyltransferase [Rhodococcus sp. (in: high G+C Gram-positive bacteria)]
MKPEANTHQLSPDAPTDIGAGSRQLSLTEWTLSMPERACHVPAPPHPELRVERAAVPSYELSHALYNAVGVTVCWTDRRAWHYTDWTKWVENPRLETWVGTVEGTPAGFFELLGHDDGSVEVVLFGLLPQFRGQGVGGAFLSACIEAGWRYSFDVTGRVAAAEEISEVQRVFLLTSTLDHPNALKNYLARGFVVESSEEFDKHVPDPRGSYLDLPFDPRDPRRP